MERRQLKDGSAARARYRTDHIHTYAYYVELQDNRQPATSQTTNQLSLQNSQMMINQEKKDGHVTYVHS